MTPQVHTGRCVRPDYPNYAKLHRPKPPVYPTAYPPSLHKSVLDWTPALDHDMPSARHIICQRGIQPSKKCPKLDGIQPPTAASSKRVCWRYGAGNVRVKAKIHRSYGDISKDRPRYQRPKRRTIFRSNASAMAETRTSRVAAFGVGDR